MLTEIRHLSIAELEAGLDHIRQSPKDLGRLEWIVSRPQVEEREALEEGHLSTTDGLVGDNWKVRGSKSTEDGSANPEMQINIMNARTIALLAQSKERWQLAGDQLFLDLDLSTENLPHGTKLAIGEAILEVTPPPHTGCKKFAERFGTDATKFVNSPAGKELHLRGVNAKVIQSGKIKVGDSVRKI
jgi:hypothetical protein